ncbi:MAG: sigma 54-interacting transcriptional regulator [Deltaproteobacteria bacterium]|jgi:transcriptional regulator with PAS, ATPase and Fis domain|nr:sigma 54-interacting transcriptional regulator [Deltaproteobacteria bacterium]
MDRTDRDHRLCALMFKKYMEISTDGVLGVDAAGRVVEINAAYCDFLGIRREDALGKPVQEIIPTTKMLAVMAQRLTDIDCIHNINNELVGVMTSRAVVLDGDVTVGAIAQIRFINQTNELNERLSKLHAEAQGYKKQLNACRKTGISFESIIGMEPCMDTLRDLAMRIAGYDLAVLLLGETGTGKEIFAHAIHNASARSGKPMVEVNCAAIPGELLESELFGYESGAFSGASKGGKPGKIELAHNGTLFLDEIADMPHSMQAKLLRVLQDGKVERLGGVTARKVDVRVIAATNKDIFQLVEKKIFRDDLYYRLNVIRLEIPPLRFRKKDIPLLVEYYLAQLNQQYEAQKFFSRAAEKSIKSYSWPGNVRELRNAVMRSFIMADTNIIDVHHLPDEIVNCDKKPITHDNIGNKYKNLDYTLYNTEKDIIMHTLKNCNYNYIKAAKILGVHRCTLYKKVKQYMDTLENV